jgi:type IV pilus assembly protein PilM
LPDYCSRIAVLEFDSFPDKPEERQSLVRFRMKKSVPFDIESAALAFHAQRAPDTKKFDVIVVTVALEVVARYEAPFRAAGLHAGLVTTSAVATADLVKSSGISLLAKLSGRVLTLSVFRNGALKLVRSVEVTDVTEEELFSVLFPTVAFIEDEMHSRPGRLTLCGLEYVFGGATEQIANRWQTELGIPVDQLRSRLGTPSAFNSGILGYLESTGAQAVSA